MRNSAISGLGLLLLSLCGCVSANSIGKQSCEIDSDCAEGQCLEGFCQEDASTMDGSGDDGASEVSSDIANDDDSPSDADTDNEIADTTGGSGDAGSGDFLEPCVTDADCNSGFCLETPDGFACTIQCGECPEGWDCRLVENFGGDLLRVCWPVFAELCTPCFSDDDCGSRSDLCLPIGEGSFCGASCEDDGLCPEGYQCDTFSRETGGAPREYQQCVPILGTCSGCLDLDGDGYGVGENCAGEDCDDGDIQSFVGALELCDGADNDCDGFTDEDFVPPDLPDVDGVDADCDFVDGQIDQSVFVSNAGNDASTGLTPADPVRTISRGLQIAATDGRVSVLVATGMYEEQLSLISGIGIYGGYTADFRSRSPANVTEVRGNPAVYAIGIDAETKLQMLAVGSPGNAGRKGNGDGGDAIGVALVDSNGVVFERCEIFAGPAGAGGTGATGASGAPGGDGLAANTSCEGGPNSDGGCKNNCPAGNSAGPFGGSGGTSVCGAFGGNGGNGVINADGLDGADGAGGTRGGDGANRDGLGAGGERGANGGDGTHGDGGRGGAPADIGIFWAGAPGADGADGGNGNGGGGGGAGGGGGVNFGLFGDGHCEAGGGGGGGGGAGGCGGEPSTGGRAGGASIAVYALRTSPALVNCVVRSGDGGVGGNGGDATPGGNGGNAGPGGVASEEFDGGSPASSGGPGGRGGNGGNGGSGGGGAGGPSFGVLITGGAGDVRIDAPTRAAIEIRTGGDGGLGGNSGTFGNLGAAGDARTVVVF